MINLQFMLEMRKLEEDDESRFEEKFNVWLSDEPLTNDEICQFDARRRTRAQTGRETTLGPVYRQEQRTEENTRTFGEVHSRTEGQFRGRKMNRRVCPGSGFCTWVLGSPSLPDF